MKENIFASIRLTESEKIQLRLDQDFFDSQLKKLENQVTHPAKGFFGPTSMTWKIYREPGIVLGGLRALFLQIAHPAVAEGVHLFSNFHEEYIYRAHRTFTSMATFYYGDTTQALQTARRLFKMHSMIRGKVKRNINGQYLEVPFCAKDPELLTWVLATLVDTSIEMYEKLHQPLSQLETEQFFEESKIIATLMGIPKEAYPKDLDDFYEYYYEMIESDQLCVTSTTLDLSKIILHPPYASHGFFRWIAGGFLPEKFAQAYQVVLTNREHKYLHQIIKVIRFVINKCPKFIRYAPPYHQAMHRIRKASGKSSMSLGGFYDWLGQTIDFPFVIKN